MSVDLFSHRYSLFIQVFIFNENNTIHKIWTNAKVMAALLNIGGTLCMFHAAKFD